MVKYLLDMVKPQVKKRLKQAEDSVQFVKTCIRNPRCFTANTFSVKIVWPRGLTETPRVPCAGNAKYFLRFVSNIFYIFRAKVSEDPSWRDGATSQFIQLF